MGLRARSQKREYRHAAQTAAPGMPGHRALDCLKKGLAASAKNGRGGRVKKVTVVGVIKKRSESCVKLRIGSGQGCVTEDLDRRDGAGRQIAYGSSQSPSPGRWANPCRYTEDSMRDGNWRPSGRQTPPIQKAYHDNGWLKRGPVPPSTAERCRPRSALGVSQAGVCLRLPFPLHLPRRPAQAQPRLPAGVAQEHNA